MLAPVVLLLAELFQNMISFPAAAVTPERELAFLSLVSAQAEEMDEKMRAKEAEPAAGAETDAAANPSNGNSADSNDTEVTLVNDAAEPVQGPAAPPPAPERRASLMQIGAQQDVSECLDNVMFQLEVALGTLNDELPESEEIAASVPEAAAMTASASSTGPEMNLLSSLFLGQTAQIVEAVGQDGSVDLSDSGAAKKEVFKILLVDVLEEEGRDLYDGLDSCFDEEIVGKSSDGLKSIRRSVALLRAPPVLQIQMQRVQFDRAKGRAFKSQAHMATPTTIYLDRYFGIGQAAGADDDDEEGGVLPHSEKRRKALALRQEAGELRVQAQLLRSGATAEAGAANSESTSSVSSTLQATVELLKALETRRQESSEHSKGDAAEQIQVDPSLASELAACAGEVDARLKAVEQRLRDVKKESSKLWEEDRAHEYVLASLFMHRGEATHGHYFLVQRKLPLEEEEKEEQVQEEQPPGSLPAPTSAAEEGQSAPAAKETWFKYNDSVVTRVEASDALRDPSMANPYLIVYVRKDLQDKLGLFQTLRRDLA